MCTLSNTCFLGPTRVHVPNGVSIGSVVFPQLTAERPYTLQCAALSPSKLPLHMEQSGPPSNTVHDSLGPSEPTTQTASRLFQTFLHSSQQNVTILYNGPSLSCQNVPSHGGSAPHLTHDSLGPPESTTQLYVNRFSRFCTLTRVTDRQTDHATQSVTTGHLYIRSTVMMPNNTPSIDSDFV